MTIEEGVFLDIGDVVLCDVLAGRRPAHQNFLGRVAAAAIDVGAEDNESGADAMLEGVELFKLFVFAWRDFSHPSIIRTADVEGVIITEPPGCLGHGIYNQIRELLR